jgi:hypothetical protein
VGAGRAVGPLGPHPVHRPDDGGARKRNVDNAHHIGVIADRGRSFCFGKVWRVDTIPRTPTRHAQPQPERSARQGEHGAGA